MPELEKVTINLNPVDLGQIELLVEQGFYANRAEFIRTAIHGQLARHADVVREMTIRKNFVIGALIWSRGSLQDAVDKGERLSARVVGLLVINEDVTPELANAAIEQISFHGVFKASAAVMKILEDRTT